MCLDYLEKAKEAKEAGDFKAIEWYKEQFDECVKNARMAFLKELTFIPIKEIGPGPVPPDPKHVDFMKTFELTTKITDDPKVSSIFATKIMEGFKEAGIEIGDNRTFAANIYIINKPQYASQMISEVSGKKFIPYVTEPKIMQSLGKKLLVDRL
jgi:hypothetical protein